MSSAARVAQRIESARTAHEMNDIAASAAVDQSIDPKDRRTLQLLFAARCRELFGHLRGRAR